MLVDSVELIKPFLSAESAEMNFLYDTQRYLLKEFSEIDRTKTREGTIHLDIWFDNLNINKDDQVTLFDFDFCGSGLLCMDIAYYILQIHSTEADETEFRKRKKVS